MVFEGSKLIKMTFCRCARMFVGDATSSISGAAQTLVLLADFDSIELPEHWPLVKDDKQLHRRLLCHPRMRFLLDFCSCYFFQVFVDQTAFLVAGASHVCWSCLQWRFVTLCCHQGNDTSPWQDHRMISHSNMLETFRNHNPRGLSWEKLPKSSNIETYESKVQLIFKIELLRFYSGAKRRESTSTSPGSFLRVPFQQRPMVKTGCFHGFRVKNTNQCFQLIFLFLAFTNSWLS